MREIPGYSLWLGHAGDIRNLQTVMSAGIVAIVDLALEETPATVPRDCLYCRFPLLDGPGNSNGLLLAVIDTTASLLRSRTPTILWCGAGMSRSPAIAAGAMSIVTGRTPDECLSQLTRSGAADVSPALWREVKAALAE